MCTIFIMFGEYCQIGDCESILITEAYGHFLPSSAQAQTPTSAGWAKLALFSFIPATQTTRPPKLEDDPNCFANERHLNLKQIILNYLKRKKDDLVFFEN